MRLLAIYSFSCCLVLSVAACGAQTSPLLPIPAGANLKDPAVLLPLAISANSLDDPKVGAWHLKASFERFDANGKPLDSGMFEEWHLAPGKSKRTYSSGQFKQTEYVTPEGLTYETDAGAAPWPLSLVRNEMIHPMADTRTIEESAPESRPFAIGSVKLSCVMLSRKEERKGASPLGRFSTYCFNPDTDLLRLTIKDDGIEAARNQIAIFRNVYIGKEIGLSDSGQPLLRIHLLDITALSETEAALVALPTQPKKAEKLVVPSAVMKGQKLRGSAPQYPVRARENRVHGRVVLQAEIGTDGRIHGIKVVSSPDPLLAAASVDAVKDWTYKPYSVNGVAVSVETTIHVVYRLGP